MPEPNDSHRFSPNPEPVAAALAEMSARLARLERRVEELEGKPAQLSAPPALAAKPAAPARALESRTGLAIVNRVGAITLALGIIFFFKYAADNRWIGAEARVALGLLAGGAMLAGAEWLWRKARTIAAGDQRLFLQGLAGCGLATVYVALYASYGYYKLIVPTAGFLFLLAASALGVLLSVRYASAAIAGLGLVGALLALLLLDTKPEQLWIDLPFLLLVAATGLFLAVRQNWPALIPLIAALDIFTAAIRFGDHHGGWFIVFGILLAACHFWASLRPEAGLRTRQTAYVCAHSVVLVAGLRGVGLFSRTYSAPSDRASITSEIGSVLLALYGAALLFSGLTRRRSLDRLVGMAFLGMVMVKLYLWDIWQLNRFYRISAFVALGAVLLGASFVYSRLRSRGTE